MSKTNRGANRAAWVERVAEFNSSGLSVPKWRPPFFQNPAHPLIAARS